MEGYVAGIAKGVAPKARDSGIQICKLVDYLPSVIEDPLQERLPCYNVAWFIHRPGTHGLFSKFKNP
ncbi:hypothetical protein ACS0TY_008524 [Phlomoides rotata]